MYFFPIESGGFSSDRHVSELGVCVCVSVSVFVSVFVSVSVSVCVCVSLCVCVFVFFSLIPTVGFLFKKSTIW